MSEDKPLLNGEIFNGRFNVFVANKNDLFFHGSSALASNLVSFPVGVSNVEHKSTQIGNDLKE